MEEGEKYVGYGYHGGGRKATGRKKIFVSATISGTQEEIDLIKQKAKEQGKSVSRYVIELVAQN